MKIKLNLQNRKRTLLIVVPVVLILLFILTISINNNTLNPGNINKLLTPTKFVAPPTQIDESTQGTNPPVKYNRVATNKILSKLENRIELSPEDIAVENRLLGATNRKPMDVSKTNDYSIQYISSADAYFVEIKNQDLGRVKKETREWFLNQGFSQDALCNKPVFYYINWDIAQQLRPLNLTFNPAADGC